MSDNSFIVKKSLSLLPQATPPLNPLKGDFYKDQNLDVLQYNGSSWVKVGSGSGAGDLDTMFTQTFDDSSLADFVQTGLVLEDVIELNGTKSAKLIHQAGVNQSFKQTIAVSEKYRGQAMTVSLLAKSAATIGNVTILFRDETNAVDLQTSQQIQADSTAKTFQYGVKIPSTCLSFSYTITALPQAGSPVTLIDDVAIKSYWMGTASQGVTEHQMEVPKITVQSSVVAIGAVSTAPVALNGASTTTKGNGLYTYNSSTGIYTAIKDFELSMTAKVVTNSSNPVMVKIIIGGGAYSSGMVANGAGIGWEDSASWSGSVAAGTTFYGSLSNGSSNSHVVSVLATAYEIETKTILSNDLVPAKAMNGSTSIEVPVPVVNEYAAVLDFNDPSTITVISQSLPFIQSVTVPSDRRWNIFFVPGTFTVNPSVQVNFMDNTGTSVDMVIAHVEPGYVQLLSNLTDATIDRIHITFTKQGVDYKDPRTSKETKTWSSTQTLITEDQDSAISIVGASGYGSVSTTTRRFLSSGTTIRGNAITIEDSPTLGTRFIANKPGIYNISYSDTQNAGSADGVIQVLIDGVGKSLGRVASEGGEYSDNTMWTGYLNVGQVVTCIQTAIQSTANNEVYFSMSHQGSVKAIQTVSDQKIEIPTHELRFTGSSSRGTVATFIVKFDNISTIKGDAFEIVNTVADGTYVTMKKAGKLDVSFALQSNNPQDVYIQKNGIVLQGEYTSGSADILSASTSTIVSVGDIIRILAGQGGIVGGANSFNLLLQEQRVAVSVSNTLPQFSDEDVIVKAWGHSNQVLAMGVTNIPFQNILQSGDGAWNGTTYTVPRDGIVNIDGMVHHGSGLIGIDVYVNGSVYKRITNAYDVITIHKFSLNEYFTKGQVLSFRLSGDGATTLIASEIAYHYLNITMRGRPTVTGVDVSAFINIPQPDIQNFSANNSAGSKGSNNAFRFNVSVVNTNEGIFSYSDDATNGTRFTAIKKGKFILSASVGGPSIGRGFSIRKNGIDLIYETAAVSTMTDSGSATIGLILQAGEYLDVYSSEAGFSGGRMNLLAEALSDQILTEPDTFSTDTAKLQYASSSQYTFATLKDAPVGTFITHNYTASSNARVQTTTPPTQSTSDMQQNGIIVTGRAYTAAGNANTPATFQIQIGKGLKGHEVRAFRLVGKNEGLVHGYFLPSSTTAVGTLIEYSPTTGIMTLDAGSAYSGSEASHSAAYNPILGTTQTAAYFTIDASKNPSLVGITKDDVAARAVSTTGQIVNAALTIITWNSTKTYDTHGALNTATGIFIAPESGYYAISAGLVLNNAAWNGGAAFWLYGIKNNIIHGAGAQNRAWATATVNVGASYSDQVYLSKGDTFSIAAYAERGATTLYSTLPDYNYFSIKKI